MSDATLDGHRVTAARVEIPAWGLTWADVTLDEEAALSGPVTLIVGDLTIKCAVAAGGPSNGTSRYRVVGGAGGWYREIPAKHYANDAGVKYSTILRDAARAVGETIEAPAGSPGTAFEREKAPAARVLQLLFREGWYVGEDGITRTGARTVATFDGTAARTLVDPLRGIIELAGDSIAALLPGVTVDGITASDVHHVLDAGKIRTTLWGARAGFASRRLAAQRRLFEQLFPDYRYRGVYEFRVVQQNGERLDLQPTRTSLGLSDMRRVRVRAGIPGARAEHTLGSLVLVAFVNADPTRPVVVGFDDPESPGWMPQELDFGEAPRLGIARLTDTVVAGPYGGTITGASARIKAGI